MKNINRNQKLIIVAISIVIIVFSLYKISSGDDSENSLQSGINTNVPVNEGNAIFQSKTDAYETAENDSERDSAEKEEAIRNSANMNLAGWGPKEKTVDEIMDSILAENKIVYDDKKDNKGKKNGSGYSGGSSGNSNQTYTSTGNSTNSEADKNKAKNDMQGFFSSNPNDKKETGGKYDPMIYATIYGDNHVPEGGRVSLRLSKEAIINGVKYERNTIIYCFAEFGNNRVFLKVNKINHNPVNLDVYDTQDGDLGIYTEANLMAETVEESSEDLSVKGLPVEKLGKKIINQTTKNKKVMLLNNYKVILKKGK